MSDDGDKKPAPKPEEIADYELRLRQLIQEQASCDANFATLKEHLEEKTVGTGISARLVSTISD